MFYLGRKAERLVLNYWSPKWPVLSRVVEEISLIIRKEQKQANDRRRSEGMIMSQKTSHGRTHVHVYYKKGFLSSWYHPSQLCKTNLYPIALAQRTPYHPKLEKLILEHGWKEENSRREIRWARPPNKRKYHIENGTAHDRQLTTHHHR